MVCAVSGGIEERVFLVRGDGRILPSIGNPVKITNNGKILTINSGYTDDGFFTGDKSIGASYDVLDYEKDAKDSKYIFTARDYTAHRLHLPYTDSSGRFIKGGLRRNAYVNLLENNNILVSISNSAYKEKELYVGTVTNK